MGRTAATAVAVAAVLAVRTAGATVGSGAVGTQDDAADDRSATPDRSITVTGQGSAEAPPVWAVLAVAVVAAGDDPATVRDDLATGGRGPPDGAVERERRRRRGRGAAVAAAPRPLPPGFRHVLPPGRPG